MIAITDSVYYIILVCVLVPFVNGLQYYILNSINDVKINKKYFFNVYQHNRFI